MARSSNTISRSAVPVVTRVQIVCGDCGGTDVLPRRTFLTAEGTCQGCGGRSYELASRVCQKLETTLMWKRVVEERRLSGDDQQQTEVNNYAN
jgi:hypothetical protein